MAAKKPWADLLDGPGKPGTKRTTAAEPAKAEAPPTTVYMHTLVGNPDNPRTEVDYTDDDADFRELKESMTSVGQLQPAVAMSREAFLRIKPEHGARIGDAEWIVILGNRRFHAAKQLGWTKFEIRVRDRLGREDDDKVDEAVIIENIHRKNIPPYKEAEFLQRMVERHGSQEKVAERIGKSQMYVSNRLSLLNLTPELRDVVDTKQLKVKTAEKIARIQDPEEQKATAAEEILKANQPRGPRRSTKPAQEPPQLQNPVLKSVPEPPQVQNPVLKPPSEPTANNGESVATEAPGQDGPPDGHVPEPRQTPHATDTNVAVPWHDGAALMDAAFERLAPAERSAFILRYFRRSHGVDAVIKDMRGSLTPQDRSSLADILQQVSDGLRHP
ncbi:ParB/RepB/Spo0J family partition protein [Streptomyces sp. NBC_00572]|uniref:ParB/RepB/Spo0J family partition protein n=1 Tax=Streptomyces sp. NBC_00572 TaxID=2903664 RepID=UPI00225AA153|nr:ParB/RepB/Spo0J family partition protein [Streptomyces sp. NBC_00572]MCX4987105.1 ParB/RepB/Spo0J family partition protein [Streptomyces sp. NBC_00572]